MLAAKNHESSKTKTEKPSPQVNTKNGTAERAQVNPLWNQLATRVQAKHVVGASDDPIQRQEEEEEILQRKFESVQRQSPEEEEEILQGKFTPSEASAQHQGNKGEAANHTGMSYSLKVGLESLSSMDLSGVRVHNNSSKPAQLNALAYTQGQDIHVGPGQEKHLPHEGWHAVQQMQGRVKPTIQAKGVSINDDTGLEREADVMGAKAVTMNLESNRQEQDRHPAASSLQLVVQTKRRTAQSSGELELDDETFYLVIDRIADILLYAPKPPMWIDLPGTGPTPDMTDVPDYFQQALWDFWVAANGTDEKGRGVSGNLRRERVQKGWRLIRPLLIYARTEWPKGMSSDRASDWDNWFFDEVHLKVIHIISLAKEEEKAKLAKKAALEKSIPTVFGGWKLLGTESFKWGSYDIIIPFFVGTEDQWRNVLQSAEDFDWYINGFLQLANDPGMVSRTRKKMARQYKNTIKRALTHSEIMAFMRAFYSQPNLELRSFWSGGPVRHAHVTRMASKIIDRYQGDLLREISISGGKGGRRVVDERAIKAVAKQGRGPSREAMVRNAIVSANEAVARLVIANSQNDQVGKSNMYQLISNAGALIRYTLDVHKEELKKAEELNTIALDLVLDITQLDKLPGIETVARRLPSIKRLLKKTGVNMLKVGAESDDPLKQAYSIAAEYEETVRKFGPRGNAREVGKLLDANSERIAINTFKTSMSVK